MKNTEKEIVQIGHEALSQVSPEVLIGDITSDRIQDIIKEMNASLAATPDGVAIAAPQIGENVRIFTVSPRVFDIPHEENLVYINPVIVKRSSKQEWKSGEGCLSVRGKYGKTLRNKKVTVEAYDEKGEKFSRGSGGFLAHIFQHEIDHLDGILFTDHAKDIEEVDMKEVFAKLKEKES